MKTIVLLFAFIFSHLAEAGFICTAHCGMITNRRIGLRVITAAGPDAATAFRRLDAKCTELYASLYTNIVFFYSESDRDCQGPGAPCISSSTNTASPANACIDLDE